MAMAKRKSGALRNVISKPSGDTPVVGVPEHKATGKKT
jgi:hypothetical protein